MTQSLLRGPVPRRLSIHSEAFADQIACQEVIVLWPDGRPVDDATAYDLDAGWIDVYSGLQRRPYWVTTRQHIPFEVRWREPLRHAGTGLETPEE